jgi:hypothetical protein
LSRIPAPFAPVVADTVQERLCRFDVAGVPAGDDEGSARRSVAGRSADRCVDEPEPKLANFGADTVAAAGRDSAHVDDEAALRKTATGTIGSDQRCLDVRHIGQNAHDDLCTIGSVTGGAGDQTVKFAEWRQRLF